MARQRCPSKGRLQRPTPPRRTVTTPMMRPRKGSPLLGRRPRRHRPPRPARTFFRQPRRQRPSRNLTKKVPPPRHWIQRHGSAERPGGRQPSLAPARPMPFRPVLRLTPYSRTRVEVPKYNPKWRHPKYNPKWRYPKDNPTYNLVTKSLGLLKVGHRAAGGEAAGGKADGGMQPRGRSTKK